MYLLEGGSDPPKHVIFSPPTLIAPSPARFCHSHQSRKRSENWSSRGRYPLLYAIMCRDCDRISPKCPWTKGSRVFEDHCETHPPFRRNIWVPPSPEDLVKRAKDGCKTCDEVEAGSGATEAVRQPAGSRRVFIEIGRTAPSHDVPANREAWRSIRL